MITLCWIIINVSRLPPMIEMTSNLVPIQSAGVNDCFCAFLNIPILCRLRAGKDIFVAKSLNWAEWLHKIYQFTHVSTLCLTSHYDSSSQLSPCIDNNFRKFLVMIIRQRAFVWIVDIFHLMCLKVQNGNICSQSFYSFRFSEALSSGLMNI